MQARFSEERSELERHATRLELSAKEAEAQHHRALEVRRAL